MKRFLSVLLVAMLIVTSLATVAFAATEVKTGETKSFTVTVSGDEFTDYQVALSADPGLKITGVDGNVTTNSSFSLVSFATSSNVTSHSFTVTVEVTATEPGTYNVYAGVNRASKYVGVENDNDGTADGWVDASLSANGASFVIVCDHEWSDWDVTKEATCTEAGSKTHECAKCGEVETVDIPKLGHDIDEHDWAYDKDNHWHTCARCGESFDVDAHDKEWITTKYAGANYDGLKHQECKVCDWKGEDVVIPANPDLDDVPGTGDITPMVNAAVAIVIAMAAAVVFLFKRMTAK